MLPSTKKILILDIVLLAVILIAVIAMPSARNNVMAGAPPAFGPVNPNSLDEQSSAERADLKMPEGSRKIASSVLSETYPDVLPPLSMEPAMLQALVEQVTYLRRRDLPGKMASGISKGELLKTVEQLKDIPVLEPNVLFQNFDFFAVKTGHKNDRVRMTGYYTPLISASKTRTEEFQYPLLERPDKGESTPSPAEIWNGALDHKAMAWVKSRKEVENAQLQGSCLVEYPDGKIAFCIADITGKGVANPLASVLSAALLLDISFGLKAEADAIIAAVDKVLKDGFRTRDIANSETPADKILGTDAMGAELLKHL